MKSLVGPQGLGAKESGNLVGGRGGGERNEAAWAAAEAGHTPEDSFSSGSPAEPRLASSLQS